MKSLALVAAVFLAEFTCPFGGGGAPVTEDPTEEQCDQQEGVCLNRCMRSTPGGMENPTGGAMQDCYAECMDSWLDNCSSLDEVAGE